MLTKEEVLKVASLAKLKLNEEEVEKYHQELNKILDCINQVNELEISNHDILISPIDKKSETFNDNVGEMINIDNLTNNAPKTSGNFIEIVRVIND